MTINPKSNKSLSRPAIRGVILFILLTCPVSLTSQVIFESPLSERIANYRIRLELDTDKDSLYAREELQWTNSTTFPARELRFHLYLNAFRSKESTFLSGYSPISGFLSQIPEEDFGGIDILRLRLDNSIDLTPAIEFIQPDDSNEHDSTVIRIPLPNPVSPGETLRLFIDFAARLPRIFARTGNEQDFFMLGQWFPKIGVFENGQWNCHQFFSNSEFYADFGVYEVDITLPKEYVVGATGILLEEVISDSLKTLSFRAEDVHDFALTAWPRFKREVRTINGVEVILLYAPEHQGQVERYFEIITACLEYTAKWLMPYPYPQLTILDPPRFALQAGGMEYPCFISSMSIWGTPASVKFIVEEITTHEFVHQYFYGILASDEAEEPWMDEGFTTYTTQKILADTYGLHASGSTFLGVDIGAYDFHKKSYMRKPDRGIVLQPSWEFTRGNYGVNTYSKPMLILTTLENILGKETMNRIMKAYLERWKFKHPRTEDFEAIVNQLAPDTMDWFFQQVLLDSCVLDYEVTSVRNVKQESGKPDKAVYISEAWIKRNGDMIIPTEIRCVFNNGDTLIEHWSGQDTLHILSFKKPSPLRSAQVDPHQKLWLDLNWTNNSYTVEEDRRALYRHALMSLQFYQQLLMAIFFF